MVMQRRGDSAHIVPNPSPAERIPNLGIDDSTIKCHGSTTFGLPLTSRLDRRSYSPERLSARSKDLHRSHYAEVHTISPSELKPASGSASVAHSSYFTSIDRPTCAAKGPSHNSLAENDLSAKYPSPVSEAEFSSQRSEFLRSGSEVTTRYQDSSVTAAATSLCGSSSKEHRYPTPSSDECSTLPKLAKESVRQYTYVDSLVDVATLITNNLWPCSDAGMPQKDDHAKRMINYFITETSRKSKTSLSTMQLALFYCVRFKRDQLLLSCALADMSSADAGLKEDISGAIGSTCPRRNFLSALILASKYLQDRNFSNKAWSKISTVGVTEINLREREFLEITKWNLDVKYDVFKDWASLMESFINDIRSHTMFGDLSSCQEKWRSVIHCLMVSSDASMGTLMSRIISNSNLESDEQLMTPASTPVLEQPEFSLLPIAPVEVAASTTISSTTSLDVVSAGTPCPFDEFLRSTPREHSASTGLIQPEASYATPDSLKVASPAYTEDDSEELPFSMLKRTAMKQGSLLGEGSIQDHVKTPSTPKMGVYGSFSALQDGGESLVLSKRSADDMIVSHTCTTEAMNDSDMASRKRVRTAF